MTPSINGYCFYIDVDEYGFNFIVCLSGERTMTVLHEEPCRGWSKEEIIAKGKAVIKHHVEDILKDNDYTDTVIVKFEIEPHIEGGLEAGASVWWHGDWVFIQLYGVEHETKFKKKAFTYGDEKVFYERFKGTLK